MQYVALLLFISALSLSQPVFAQTWSDPISAPPSDNASTPLNVSATSQAKAGGIAASSFLSTGSMAAQGNIGVGMSSAPDAFGVLGSGTYGDAYSRWSSLGRAFSAFPLSLSATDYGLGTVWDGSGAFFGLTNSGTNKKDTVVGWGSSLPNPTDLIYKYNGGEVARITSGGRLGVGTTTPTQKLSVVGNITGTQLCIGTDCRSSWPSAGGSGTVSSIVAGTGLTGGTITASGTIAADTTYLQRRVSGTCAAGNAVQTIAADGTVTCQSVGGAEADTLATVTTRGNTTTNGVSVGSLVNTGGSYFAGNVGVGVMAPSAKLEVSDGGNASVRIGTTDNRTNANLQVKNAIHAWANSATAYGEVGATDMNAYNNGTSPTFAGIFNRYYGTSAAGTVSGIAGAANAAGASVLIGQNSTSLNLGVNGANPINFFNSGGTKMTVLPSGNVGIGTSTPASKLTVAGVIESSTGGVKFPDGTTQTTAAGASNLHAVTTAGNTTTNGISVGSFINNGGSYFAGNVGIGTATPGAKLDVAGAINATTLSLAGAPAYVNEGYGWRYHGDSQHPLQVLDGAPVAIGYTATGGTYPSSGLVVSGNAGIGTASPTQKLEVAGDTLSNNTRFAAGNGNGICFWNDCNNYKITMGNGAEYQYGGVTDYSIKSTMNNGASNRGWTWGYSGVAPVASISGGGALTVAANGTFSGNTQIGMVSQGFYGDGGNLAIRAYNSGSSGIYFQTYNGGATNMYLSNSGYLGVGNAAPSERLDVSGGMRMGSGNFTQNLNHGNYHLVVLPAANNGASNGDAGLYSWISEPAVSWTGAGIARNMRNTGNTTGTNGGFPRINTALSGQMIRFDEGTGINFTVEDTAGTRTNPMWMNASTVTTPNLTGTIATFNTLNANSFVYSSDRKLKKNIEPIKNALDKITSLNGVMFNWKTDKDGAEKKIGLIAQDVEKVFPEAVVGTTTKGVEYANLVAPLIEAVKEQQKTIESQDARIKALEEKLNKLVK